MEAHFHNGRVSRVSYQTDDESLKRSLYGAVRSEFGSRGKWESFHSQDYSEYNKIEINLTKNITLCDAMHGVMVYGYVFDHSSEN